MLALEGLSFDMKKARARRPRERNVVDVDCVIKKAFDDGDTLHYHLHVQVTHVRLHDPDVEEDLSRCIDKQELVFVAIRHGDRMGIPGEVPGLTESATIELKGEWIPREQAYAHGGEKLSVMHFTHHDLGFVAVNGQIYS
jgi:endonuclease G